MMGGAEPNNGPTDRPNDAPNDESTEEKRKIEKALKEKGYLPRTQCFMGGIYVAIAFPEEKIAIQIDDESNITPQQRMVIKNRDLQLQEKGWKVFRYSNEKVNKDPIKIALNIIDSISAARGKIELPADSTQPVKPEISIYRQNAIRTIDNARLAAILSVSIFAFGLAYILIRGILDLGSFLMGSGLIAVELAIMDILFGEKQKKK